MYIREHVNRRSHKGPRSPSLLAFVFVETLQKTGVTAVCGSTRVPTALARALYEGGTVLEIPDTTQPGYCCVLYK